jgi:predicted ABC-type ATPase
MPRPAASRKPVLLVLAGVNGAGKSSIGGLAIQLQGMSWFNPDSYTRALMAALPSLSLEEANGLAWTEGKRRLDAAIAQGESYAFETTLGGNSIAETLRVATDSHDVNVWFCGLDSVERHLERVKLRVAAGGHDIAEHKIRERYNASPLNLLMLMPRLARLSVYDNSVSVMPDEVVPEPRLVLKMERGRVLHPITPQDLAATPVWAQPLVERALQIQENAGGTAI